MAILIGWVLYVSSKQIERNRRIQTEVSALETEAAKIRRENETLSEKISYFASDDFRIQEAKKIGLKKAEETVVVIKPQPENEFSKSATAEERQSAEQGATGSLPNYKKWWNIFWNS
ncbi:MAG: hypothetical protein A2878_01365 [Candidatus Moranbacteria bacterium RIFCSPHIGHO2_01_FULL_54_31]|nr:MAG: hypothetical protein A2878_01365 [Candidatus Moranbacteria bacterium RIFCSPHIGHO2_01_FULL_54_31]